MNGAMTLVFAAASVPIFVIGRMMRHGQRIDLISGLDVKRVANPAGLARFFGDVCYAIGVVTVASGLALDFAPRQYQMTIGIGFVVVVNLLVAVLLFGVVRRSKGTA
jgi:hypothetical protein